jgi:hypothetical protein
VVNIGTSTGIKDITGIYYAGAALGSQPCTLANNLVSLGHGMVNNHVYKGIDDFGYSGNNLLSFFNSVNIGGTSAGSSNSYACLKRDVTNETHKNDIYVNTRTGGTGKHYSIGNTAIAGTYISDFNDLFTAAGPLAIWNIVDQPDLNAWRTASGQDVNSKSVNPGFVSATDMHPTQADLDGAGLTISGIPADFAGVMRGSPPDIGAYEFTPAPSIWNGIVSSDWYNPLNWTPNGVPSSGISVSISAGTPNLCIVTTSGAVCKDMILDGAVFSINLTVTITVYGNLTKQNNAVLNNNGILTVNGDFINN